MIVYTENIYFLTGIQHSKYLQCKHYENIEIYDLDQYVFFYEHNHNMVINYNSLFYHDDFSNFINLILNGLLLKKENIKMSSSYIQGLYLTLQLKQKRNRTLNVRELSLLRWILSGGTLHEYAKIKSRNSRFIYNKKTEILHKLNISSFLRLYHIYLTWDVVRSKAHFI